LKIRPLEGLIFTKVDRFNVHGSRLISANKLSPGLSGSKFRADRPLTGSIQKRYAAPEAKNGFYPTGGRDPLLHLAIKLSNIIIL
jgi:hypothetical protein